MRTKTTAMVVFFLFQSLVSLLSVNASENNVQRESYLFAEKLLWQSDSQQFKEQYNSLHFYPLQPYLDQQILINKMSLVHIEAIDKFLTKYQDSPLDRPLRIKWLNYLAEHKQPKLFLQYYHPTTDPSLQCQYYNYQLDAGMPESIIFPKVSELWLVGKSQVKTCDSLFKKWQHAGYQTPDKIWQRISLAADGGKHTLVPYLAKLLPEEDRYLGELWIKTRGNPSYISQLKRFPNKSAKEAEIVIYGLKRLIWRDQSLALKTYKKAIKLFSFTEDQHEQINDKFAIALTSKNHKDALEWLDKVDTASLTTNMVQWRLVQVLKNQDWAEISNELFSLPEYYKQSLQWKYWYARALIETDKLVEGSLMLNDVAQQRHYYGFLAANILNLPINLQEQPLNITEEEKIAVLEYPAGKRAFELFYLNRFYQARSEWNYWLESLNDREKLVASKLANEAKWYDRAIFTLSAVGYLNDIDLRFPMAFDKKINKHAEKQNINPSWAFAIARRESSFMTDANSPAGAKGLMQLMPNTAKQLQQKTVSNKFLFDASNNINLGTKYLKKLLDKNNGNHVLATASYNAGPHRVKSWLKNIGSLPTDIWIETIPYKETREYVKSVLAYQQIYQTQVGQASSIFDQVVNIDISH